MGMCSFGVFQGELNVLAGSVKERIPYVMPNKRTWQRG